MGNRRKVIKLGKLFRRSDLPNRNFREKGENGDRNFFKSLPKDMLIDFRERRRKGKRERNIVQSVPSRMCTDQGLNLQPRPVLGPGIEPTTFWFMG